MTTRVLIATLLVWAIAATEPDWLIPDRTVGVTLLAQQPAPVEEFVPIDQLPPQDQLPAAPLLVAAYAFVVLALFAYVASLVRRLGGVQRDIERLQADLKRPGRS
jgi:CcmD family protein